MFLRMKHVLLAQLGVPQHHPGVDLWTSHCLSFLYCIIVVHRRRRFKSSARIARSAASDLTRSICQGAAAARIPGS